MTAYLSRRLALASLALTAVAGLMVSGCGGDDLDAPDADYGQIDLSSSSTDYNGYFSNFKDTLERSVSGNKTTLTVRSGIRRFQIVLSDDVLKKGQRFDLSNSNDARATYDEGSDKIWIAVDGTAEVTDELLGNFTVRLRDLEFVADDDAANQALGTFDVDGRLVRR